MDRQSLNRDKDGAPVARVLSLADFARSRVGSGSDDARASLPATGETPAPVLSYDVAAEMRQACLGADSENDFWSSLESALGDLHRRYTH